MAFALRHETMSLADMQAIRARIEQHIREHRGWYIFQGVAFLVAGLLAAILPAATVLSATLIIGAALLVTGVLQFIASFQSRSHWWAFFSALLSIATGGWMLWMPLFAALALAIVVAAFLSAEGILEILLAFEFRPARNWGWMLASGLATLVLSIFMWSGLPVLSVVYLGLLIAINFIFYGVSLLMLAGSLA